MKKLILIFAMMIPVLAMGQKSIVDSLTVETDTIVRYRITNANYLTSWYMYADSLQGTLDGTVKLVVANDLDDSNVPASASTIPDSLFMQLDVGLVDTLNALKPYAFFDEPIPFDYIGLEYNGLDITPCDLIRHYDPTVSCTSDQTIFAQSKVGGESNLVDAWPDLTAKLRIR